MGTAAIRHVAFAGILAAAGGTYLAACGARTDLQLEYDAGGGSSDSGRLGDSAKLDCEGDSGAPPPSCAPGGPGMTDCGANHENCCASRNVTGGVYYRTYSNTGNGPTGKMDAATISGFRLDKYDVTVGRFRQFVAAWNGGAGYTPPTGSGKHAHLNGCRGLVNVAAEAGVVYEMGWVAPDDGMIAPTDANLLCGPYPAFATWTPSAGDNDTLPINCENWYEAYAFCIWDGGFLPSEAEWEYAAAGGALQREYPWGSTAPGMGNQYAIYGNGAGGCDYPSPGPCTGVVNIAPVGSAPLGAGLWGQLDLVGDLGARVLDEFAARYVDPCVDCAYLPLSGDASERVFRGEYYGSTASNLLVWDRYGDGATDRDRGVGFRCARAP